MLACNPASNTDNEAENFPEKPHPVIDEMVSDLTEDQKSQIDALMETSRNTIDSLREKQRVIRDSINYYTDSYGNKAEQVYPLYEQEAALQVEINKMFYQNKLRIDSILTKEQYQEFSTKMKQDREDAIKHHPHDSTHHHEHHHGPEM